MRSLLLVASMLVGCASTTAATSVTAPSSGSDSHAPNSAPADVKPAAPEAPSQELAQGAQSTTAGASAPAAQAASTDAPKEDLAGLRAQVRARRAELTACYAKTSAARSGINGCVPVHFTLASDGRMRVSSAPKFASSDLRSRMASGQCGSNPRLVDPALESCVAKVFARIKVDQPRSTESVEGIYPVYFASK